jgi:hypothetical protein
VVYNSDWIDKSRFLMATIRTPANELHWMQSFIIDPEKQKYEIVRVPEEKIVDISSVEWKIDSLKTFLVYMDKQSLHFIILQQNDIIFDQNIFIDFAKGNTTKVYFELYSQSKKLALFSVTCYREGTCFQKRVF